RPPRRTPPADRPVIEGSARPTPAIEGSTDSDQPALGGRVKRPAVGGPHERPALPAPSDDDEEGKA
ncbi:MAG TPA: hypothetical protein VGB74_03600, partial [Actinoplanes sp.]